MSVDTSAPVPLAHDKGLQEVICDREVGAEVKSDPGFAGKAAQEKFTIKVRTPQIHWHGRQPIFAIDFHPHFNRLCATGGQEPDGSGGVHLWIINDGSDGSDTEEIPVRFVQDLVGHEKTVNCLRFSPSGDMLATGGGNMTSIYIGHEFQ
jgi:WD40 repeat protein